MLGSIPCTILIVIEHIVRQPHRKDVTDLVYALATDTADKTVSSASAFYFRFVTACSTQL
jgi:hypothetical protein